ncbi:MFS transporter [Sphingobacterium sp. ML3W]|uniref:MFS transporter n=1 Tax=Sphingobacterium sp. ML3W TaxID=1538644 RepID=UPI0004F8126F|nr:MFS transporter [Sphingobacterium sp. ML3W]AIM37231.1 MFS transporter [Sphingobacterium sp. ML3W]
MIDTQTKNAKKATQFIFLVCGLAISSWAPMVPYVKERLQINDAELGILLLFLGLGAVIMMPITGLLSKHFGNRILILCSTAIIAITLPLLLVISSVSLMALCIFIFGASIGTIDVAMNSHGILVQNKYQRPIMSSLHGLFSLGGLFGSLGLGFLIKIGLVPQIAAISISLLLCLIVLGQFRNLLDLTTEKKSQTMHDSEQNHKQGFKKMFFHKAVLFLGLLCFASFLSEGAMLDWSAVFLKDLKGIDLAFTGAGYATFSIAMASMRLMGDRLVEKLNGRTIVIAGSLIASLGLIIATYSSWIPLVLFGFLLLGIGSANLVPIFFSDASRIKSVTTSVSIPAITTMGYAGQLMGPAILGLIAHQFNLEAAFLFSATLMILIAILYSFRK